MTKRRALLIHFLVSATVLALLTGVLVEVWYPMPYFWLDGGWQGVRLVGAVDLALGPLLTLVVYRPTKPRRTLLFDYGVVAAFQLAAFGLGVWTILAHRTVLAVFADGCFYSIDAETAARLGPRAEAILRASATPPSLGFVRMPEDAEGRQRLRKESLATRRPLTLRGDLLEAVGPGNVEQIGEYALDSELLARKQPAQARALARFVEGRRSSSEMLLPLSCRYGIVTLALDRKTGTAVGWTGVGVAPGDRPRPRAGPGNGKS